jgi:tetratricopeptide (TPR) repeat protein
MNHLARLTLATLLILGPAASAGESPDAALKARRWSEAARLADAELAAAPTAAPARPVRGFARARLGDFQGSLADFTTVLAQDAGEARAWHGAAKTLRMLGDLPAGLLANDRALALAPDTADYLVEKGVNLFLAHDFAPSSAAFERVHALNPAYPGINAYRTELFLYLRDASSAAAAATEGVQREPKYGIHRINLAHAALFAGDLPKARELYLASADLIDMDGVTPGRDLVPQDFAKMRAAGVEVPGMNEILELLKKK